MIKYYDNSEREIHDNSISNCVISGCKFTINIGNINMKFGDINISIGEGSSSRKRDNRQESVFNSDYSNEEIEARMKFFKANSP